MRRAIATFILSLALCGVAAAVEPERPAWCKPGWECIQTKEMADDTLQHIALHTEIIRLKSQLSRRWWATVGAEYLPNTDEYQPYGIGGVNLGRVSVWGGFFGDIPAVGVGWRF